MTMTPQQASARTREICMLAPIVPVLVVHDPAHAKPLAQDRDFRGGGGASATHDEVKKALEARHNNAARKKAMLLMQQRKSQPSIRRDSI